MKGLYPITNPWGKPDLFSNINELSQVKNVAPLIAFPPRIFPVSASVTDAAVENLQESVLPTLLCFKSLTL